MRGGGNDMRILAVAANLADDGSWVTVVSKDVPMRVKAAALGITAEEYLAEQAVDSGWTGLASLSVSGDEMSDLYEAEVAARGRDRAADEHGTGDRIGAGHRPSDG